MDTKKKENILRIIALILAMGVGTLVFASAGTLIYYLIKYSFFLNMTILITPDEL